MKKTNKVASKTKITKVKKAKPIKETKPKEKIKKMKGEIKPKETKKSLLKNVSKTHFHVNTIKDLSFEEIIPNSIENVILYTNEEGKKELDLPTTMGKETYKLWSKSRGGIFSEDFSAYLKGTLKAKYLLLTAAEPLLNSTNIEKSIIRVIEKDEEERFKSLKLVDGIIKDKYYMVLKDINDSSEPINSTKRYIIEDTTNIIVDAIIPVGTKKTEDEPTNVSLFED